VHAFDLACVLSGGLHHHSLALFLAEKPLDHMCGMQLLGLDYCEWDYFLVKTIARNYAALTVSSSLI